MQMTNEKELKKFWVIFKNKPMLIEGFIKKEDPDDWCAGEERFYSLDGQYMFFHWADSATEILKKEIKSIEDGIWVQKEFLNGDFPAEIEQLEKEKEHFIKLSEIYKEKIDE